MKNLMTQYHRWLLSELISNKRCITSLNNTIVLLGTLQLVTNDNSIYPKGTILFEDETGKVPCFLIGYEKEWFTETIALLSWSFFINLINKQPNRKEVCYLEVHSDILFLRVGVSEALCSKKSTLNADLLEKRRISNQNLFQQFNSLTISIDMLFNLGKDPTKPLPKVNLIAMVNMKSVLHQSEDKITFIVTLNEVHDPRSFLHIVFNGDQFIEYYKIIMVGGIYIFKDMKLKETFNDEKIFPIFEANSIDSVEYINKELAITYNNTEQTQNSTDLTSSCFSYEGKYPEYNPLIVPYRLGMKLLLHNIHAIKFTMKKDIWKLDNHKNCPSFRNVKVIFAACHCSTIQVIRFPRERIESDLISQKIISKFSSFRNSSSFTLLELLWVQKVYYDISKKFPGEFEDQILLSNPRPSKSDYNKVEDCLLSRLLRRYRVTKHFKDLVQEYFGHKIYCCITEKNQEMDIKLPPISEVLQLINELFSSQSFSSEIYGENQLKVFSQLEAKLEKTHLMGFLEGGLDGTLQLKDQTGDISLVNISFEEIQIHHLNNIWIIPEYELVIEQPCKIYLRFSIEKCFCFYKKSHDLPFYSNQSVFQVKHIFPTKLNYSSENLTPSCKLQIEIISDNSVNSLEDEKSTFINLSRDFIKILPAMHVGLLYELSFDKSEQIVSPMEKLITFNLDNFTTANIINIQLGGSFNNKPIFKDLFGKFVRPKILRLSESSKNLLRDFKTAFLIEDKPLNVQEILNGNFINSSYDAQIHSKLVSLKGLIVSKEIQSSITQPNFMYLGQSKTSLLLRIKDVQAEEIIDIYMNNISRYVIPIGLIPGQIIILRKVEPKKFVLGNIYCYASGITHISLQGLDTIT